MKQKEKHRSKSVVAKKLLSIDNNYPLRSNQNARENLTVNSSGPGVLFPYALINSRQIFSSEKRVSSCSTSPCSKHGWQASHLSTCINLLEWKHLLNTSVIDPLRFNTELFLLSPTIEGVSRLECLLQDAILWK